MPKHITRRFNQSGFRLLIPLFMAATVVQTSELFSLYTSAYTDILIRLPYVAFTLIIVLAHPFNQGRIAQAAFLMLLSYWLIQYPVQSALEEMGLSFDYVLLTLLLPFNLSVLLILPERRPLSQPGLTYKLWIVVLILAVHHYSFLYAERLGHVWASYLFHLPQYSSIPLLSACLYLVTICLLGLAVAQRSKTSDTVLYTCLVLSFVSLFYVEQTMITTQLYTLCAVSLFICLLSSSHQLAFVDTLTGIAGRRALEDEMKHLNRQYTLAMLDVDHFKKFNDTHGHEVGDDVLRVVAKQMSLTGGGAQVFRYGGEEFTVLFKGKTPQQCKIYLEELRERIANYAIVLRDKQNRPTNAKKGKQMRSQAKRRTSVSVTISIGIADGRHHISPAATMKTADNALYKAKDNGRNCSVIS